MTFGIEPTHPATGYGYIKARSGVDSGALPVESFVEKPDLETAKTYLDEGEIEHLKQFGDDTPLEDFFKFVCRHCGQVLFMTDLD